MYNTPNQVTSIPWGPSESLELRFPSDWPAPQRLEPDLTDGFTLDAYPDALRSALDDAERSLPLDRRLSHAHAKVAIVVDDPSRWTPVRQALPIVLQRLHAAGVDPQHVSISVGVGRHHALDDSALRQRLGDTIVDSYACHSPPVDNADHYSDHGTTEDGVPVRVFKPVAQADLRILIGSVLPHMQAGFGGGLKLIFPGCSHRETLGALHRQGLGEGPNDAARLLGRDIEHNAMRRAIRHAAARLPGQYFSISHLLGPPGQILRVAAGDVDSVQHSLSAEAARRFHAPIHPPGTADIVFVGNHPWPGDPMQSFKVLLNHRAAAAPDGILVGLFWTDPAEIDRSFPMAALRTVAATGAVGGWVVRRGLKTADRFASALKSPSRFMLRWARELVADRPVLVYAPPLHERVGPRLGPVRLFDNLHDLSSCAAKILGRRPERVALFPSGGLTYVAAP